MHPQIAAPGSGVQGADVARSAMTATFKPRSKGRPVKLQRRKGNRWVTVAKRRQSGRGTAEFTAPFAVKGAVASYRVQASRYRKLKPVSSSGVSTSLPGAADFTDEFTGTTLDATWWATREQDYQPASKRTCSRSSDDATRVSGGVARLSVLPDPPDPLDLFDDRAPRCSYDGRRHAWRINGHIGTEDRYSFTYGYAAARIKFQPRRGQHGAFWLMPQDQAASEGSAAQTGAEIDVVEWFGNGVRGGGLASFIHHWPDDGASGVTAQKVGGYIKKPQRFGGGWADRYHVFSVEWTPQRYVFRIDGRESFRTTRGVSGQPEYLILSLLSSDYELKHIDDDQLPQSMSVDWVRTWER